MKSSLPVSWEHIVWADVLRFIAMFIMISVHCTDPFNFTPFCTHMWYIYLLIGLYLFMPIFSAWIKDATDKQKKMYLYIWGITLFMPYVYEYVSN